MIRSHDLAMGETKDDATTQTLATCEPKVMNESELHPLEGAIIDV